MTNTNFAVGDTGGVTPVSWAFVHVDFESSWASENPVVTNTPFTGIHLGCDFVNHFLPVVGSFFPDAVKCAAIEGRSVFIDFLFFVVTLYRLFSSVLREATTDRGVFFLFFIASIVAMCSSCFTFPTAG